jgi:anthranilate/para-aminobenzoate synthase component II
MLLMIDNYDSFTYNLVQYLGELGADVCVYRNDKITLKEIESLQPEKIVISPGPCTPAESPYSGCAWGIKVSVRLLGVGLSMRAKSCMARHHGFTMAASGCFRGCRIPSRRPATTRW